MRYDPTPNTLKVITKKFEVTYRLPKDKREEISPGIEIAPAFLTFEWGYLSSDGNGENSFTVKVTGDAAWSVPVAIGYTWDAMTPDEMCNLPEWIWPYRDEAIADFNRFHPHLY